MKHNAKDYILRMLFYTPQFLLELYKALFPDAEDVKEVELEDVIIANYLVNERHNDIAFK